MRFLESVRQNMAVNHSLTTWKIKSHKEDYSNCSENCLSLCHFPLIFIIFAYTLAKATEICEVIWIHDEGCGRRWVNLALAVHNCKEWQSFFPVQCLSGMEISVSNFPFTFSGRLENIPKWNCKSWLHSLRTLRFLVSFKNELSKCRDLILSHSSMCLNWDIYRLCNRN